MAQAQDWPEISGVISDLDGVVYRGEAAIPGAAETFARWRRAGVPYGFVTNNSTRTPEEVALKLRGFGVECAPEQVTTSALATAEVLRERWAGARVFVIGAPALKAAISAAGFKIGESQPQVVVMGLDREISHAKLRIAVEAILAGATLIGTNPDLLLPAADGFEPGAGAMLTAVAAAARVKPIVIGKPEPTMILSALRRLGAAKETTLMIGDQLATDIQAGKRAGLPSVLVRTGVPEIAEDGLLAPDFVVDSLTEIPG